MNKEVLIHIGYPKTGTTWLQNFLFTDQTLGFAMAVTGKEIRAQLVDVDALDFDEHKAAAFFQPKLEAVRTEKVMPVVSRERLSGHYLSGPSDSAEIAQRLHSVFPQGKILMVIRNQEQMLYSAYGQVVKGRSISWPIHKYIAQGRAQWSVLHRLFPLQHFEYDRLIRRYHLLFGQDNVLVLPYEQFRSAPHDFVLAILAFCGGTVDKEAIAHLPFGRQLNPSLSGISLAMKRRLNWLFGSRNCYNPFVFFSGKKLNRRFLNTLFLMDRLLPTRWKKAVETRQRQQIARVVGHTFGPSNRRTAELTGLDLATLGYQLED